MTGRTANGPTAWLGAVMLAMGVAVPAAAKDATAWDVYGLIAAGESYCAGLKAKRGVRAAVARTYGEALPYPGSEGFEAYQRARADVLATLREVSRERACANLMRDYGPGAPVELFRAR